MANAEEIGHARRALLELTASIVVAYVSNHFIPAGQVPILVEGVHAAIRQIATVEPEAEPTLRKATSAQIRRSITPDGLISFIDGKPYRQIGKHLAAHGMSFTEYRLRFGLPHDYPSAAPNHSAMRAEQAVANGLGNRYGRHIGRKERA